MDIEADAIGGIHVDGRRLECRGDDIALLVGDADDIEQLVVDDRIVYPARIGRGAADDGLLVAEMERRDLRPLERPGDILLDVDRLVRILSYGGSDRLTPLETGLFHHRRPCPLHPTTT